MIYIQNDIVEAAAGSYFFGSYMNCFIYLTCRDWVWRMFLLKLKAAFGRVPDTLFFPIPLVILLK